MKTALILLASLISFSSFAGDIKCSVKDSDLEITVTEENLIVSGADTHAVYPRVIANRTYPEFGIVSAFKGRYRRAGSTSDYSVLTMRMDVVQGNVVLGSISMSGRDKSLPLHKAIVACDKEVLALFNY